MKDHQKLTIDFNSITVYFRNHILITSRPQIPHCISFWHNIWTYALILNAATISIYHTVVFFWGWYNIKMSVVFQLCKIYHADFPGAWRAYEIQGIVSILLFRCNANNVFVIISSSYAKKPFDVFVSSCPSENLITSSHGFCSKDESIIFLGNFRVLLRVFPCVRKQTDLFVYETQKEL